jgi:hypothetical protein
MALTEIDATCASCHTSFRGKPARTFLGFQRLRCPKCSQQVDYPLTSGFRITYWVLVALMALAVVVNLSEGKIAVPGILGILIIVALARDWKIRKQVVAVAGKAAGRAPTSR